MERDYCIFVSAKCEEERSNTPHKCKLKEKLGKIDWSKYDCMANNNIGNPHNPIYIFNDMSARRCFMYAQTIEEAQQKASDLVTEIILIEKGPRDEGVESKITS